MNNPLDELVPNLENLPILESEFEDIVLSKWNDCTAVLNRTAIFPSDYVTSYETLEETALPNKEKFCHREETSEENFLHACKVWKAFNIKTIGEFEVIL